MTNIIFFGSSEYSIIILQKLIKIKDFNIKAVFTKPDKPFGRQQIITPNSVTAFALKNKLPLLQPETFDSNLQSTISNLNPDLGLVVAYGPPFFTPELIEIPKYKIVNIHPSPLPKYRGATPGPWQIINQESQSAVTFFQIDPLPDHGPIITQIPFEISPQETSATFYQKAFGLASDHLESVLKTYISQPQSITTQDHTQKTYFPKLTKAEAQINWTWEITKIESFIRALNPWPIAWTYIKTQQNQKLKMKIFSAEIKQNNLIPNLVQIEGKSSVYWSDISKYYSIIK